ncbi:MBL fold metallo-hydrolase [Dyadobacter helix]|nr:MBL fold metallo-hydrolase [Dyadobacter sp. CECT 9275]
MLISLIIFFAIAVFLILQLKSFGKEPTGARLERIRKSPNYRNGSFQNLTKTPVNAENSSFTKILVMFMFGKDKNAEPIVPLPSVRTNLKGPPQTQPTITYFGHSSYLIQIDGKNILMDPVFCERTSPVQFLGSKNFEGTHVYGLVDMPRIDFVFLSHDHYDHMDYETLREFTGRETRFVVPLGAGEHLEYWGISPAHITELDWWEETSVVPGLKITSTPARHFSGRNFNRGKSLWTSYVMQSDSYRIFLGGDSGYEKHFAEIGSKFGPFDLAILECGQYNEMWPYIHMMPEETAQASVDLRAKVLWPVHWGKFALGMHAWNEPIIRVSKKAEEMGIKLTTPRIGEQIVLPNTLPDQKWWELPMKE